MPRETILVFAALVVLASGTQVLHCDSDTPFEDPNQVQISGCNTPPCILRKGTTVSIDMKFTPKADINSLTTSVSAIIADVPLPFIGVDGQNACEHLYKLDGTKISCPLQKGVEYRYKNQFPILQLYPRLTMNVRYSLEAGRNSVICCLVPAKIS